MKATELKHKLEVLYVDKQICLSNPNDFNNIYKVIDASLPISNGHVLISQYWTSYFIHVPNICKCTERVGQIKFHYKRGEYIIKSIDVEFAENKTWDEIIEALYLKKKSQDEYDKKINDAAVECMKYLASLKYKRDEAQDIAHKVWQDAMCATDIFGEETNNTYTINNKEEE